MAEYHAAILELLQRGTNRRIGAIALAGLGSANPDEVCALTKIANEQDKYEFLNLIAAHALARIGQEDRAAETLVAILGRNNFTNFINELDELDPWEELISLSAEVRARLPQEVFDLCTSDSIKERLRAK
jgi:hypothetical protein